MLSFHSVQQQEKENGKGYKGVKAKSEPLRVDAHNLLEKVYYEGIEQYCHVIHCHNKAQSKSSLLGR